MWIALLALVEFFTNGKKTTCQLAHNEVCQKYIQSPLLPMIFMLESLIQSALEPTYCCLWVIFTDIYLGI